MNEPPDHTAELSAANLLSFGGMTLPKYCFTQLRVLPERGVHVAEDDALLLEVLAVAVVDDFGLVLGVTPARYLLLGLGDAELLVGLLDLLGQLVPLVDDLPSVGLM